MSLCLSVHLCPVMPLTQALPRGPHLGRGLYLWGEDTVASLWQLLGWFGGWHSDLHILNLSMTKFLPVEKYTSLPEGVLRNDKVHLASESASNGGTRWGSYVITRQFLLIIQAATQTKVTTWRRRLRGEKLIFNQWLRPPRGLQFHTNMNCNTISFI